MPITADDQLVPAGPATPADRADPLIGWMLLAGGAIFFIGGSMHPKEDPPGVSTKEHLRVMFEDRAWYPSHLIVLAGIALIAISLVLLVHGRTLIAAPSAQRTAVIAMVASVLGTFGMFLHLIAATEADKIVAHQSTPIIDVNGIVETFTVPFFGFSIAALAIVGAVTRTLGNRVTAVLGVLGGVGFGLAGATILFTDRLDFLFPAAAGIGLWSIAAGTGLLMGSRPARLAARHSMPGE